MRNCFHFLLLLLITVNAYAQSSWLPKIVWTYWDTQSEQMLPILKAFRQNHIKYSQGWDLRYLDKQSMWSWADQIPDFKQTYSSSEWSFQSQAKKSDLLRIALISYFGGVYFDFTTILTRNLDWILDIKSEESIQNKNGKYPDLFILYSTDHGYKSMVLDPLTNTKFLLLPTFESFFMAGKPNNTFCLQWLKFVVETKKMSFQKYGANQKESLFFEIAEDQDIQKGGYKTPYFQILVAANIVLHRKQKQLDNMTANTETRRLAVKEYNIWVMGTNKSAYIDINFGSWLQIMAQTDINWLKQAKKFPPFFVKLNQGIMHDLTNFLMFKSQFSDTISQQEKAQKNFILRSSILYEYLLGQKYNNNLYNEIVDEKYYRSMCKVEYYQSQVKRLRQKIEQNEIKQFVKNRESDQVIEQLKKQILNLKTEIANYKVKETEQKINEKRKENEQYVRTKRPSVQNINKGKQVTNAIENKEQCQKQSPSNNLVYLSLFQLVIIIFLIFIIKFIKYQSKALNDVQMQHKQMENFSLRIDIHQ